MPVGKVSGTGLRGSALIKRANKLGVKHAELKSEMKASRGKMINNGIDAGILGILVSDRPMSIALVSIASVLLGIIFCVNINDFMKAYKEKRKIKHEMDVLMKNPNLKDAVNQKLGSEKGAELPTTTKEALKFFKEIYA